MAQEFKIYIDRLRNESEERIHETFEPLFLQTPGEELEFKDPVFLKGQVYLADDHLIIDCAVKTLGYFPCSICNEPTRMPIDIPQLHLTIPLEEIKGVSLDLLQHVREEILLNTPQFIECREGHCPERESLKKFIKTDPAASQPKEDSYFPFADL